MGTLGVPRKPRTYIASDFEGEAVDGRTWTPMAVRVIGVMPVN